MTVTDSDGTNFFFFPPPSKAIRLPTVCAITETEMVRWLGQLGGKSEILFLTEKLNVGAFRGGMCGKVYTKKFTPFHLLHFLRRYLLKFSEWKFHQSSSGGQLYRHEYF